MGGDKRFTVVYDTGESIISIGGPTCANCYNKYDITGKKKLQIVG